MCRATASKRSCCFSTMNGRIKRMKMSRIPRRGGGATTGVFGPCPKDVLEWCTTIGGPPGPLPPPPLMLRRLRQFCSWWGVVGDLYGSPFKGGTLRQIHANQPPLNPCPLLSNPSPIHDKQPPSRDGSNLCATQGVGGGGSEL